MLNELKKMKTCNAHALWQPRTYQVQNFKRLSRNRKIERKEAWMGNEKVKKKNMKYLLAFLLSSHCFQMWITKSLNGTKVLVSW